MAASTSGPAASTSPTAKSILQPAPSESLASSRIPAICFARGGYGRVRASVNTQNGALLVPQRAVTELQGSQQVVVVTRDDKASIRPVTVGDKVGNLWIVTEGLKPGERVVVDGLQKVRDGATVKVVPPSGKEGG